MRRVILVALALTLLFFFLPILLIGGSDPKPSTGEEETHPPTTVQPAGTTHTLRVLLDGQVQEMTVNDYLWGVVAAEMPASFELEALKAQAVAARTYALNRGQSQAHPNADVCGDYTCCQAYIAPEKAKENWGENAAAYAEKITQAVEGTGNQVILYDNALINAVFHSSSGEKTLDAVEVWGGNVPYLVGVESPEGDEVPNYHSDVTVSVQDFKDAFTKAHGGADLSGTPDTWFGDTVYTAGGSVSHITVGGVAVRGQEMRTLFSLRSASFTVEANQETVTFHVTGYGHGVGMSQYGANAMAKEGKTYQDILTWYYTGVTVEECPDSLWKS